MGTISKTVAPGQPYAVRGWTLVVSVECLRCQNRDVLHLTDSAPTGTCACGASYSLGGLMWDITQPLATQVAIANDADILLMPH